MSSERMHADEVPTDVGLVTRLIGAQFPQWAGLPIVPVASAGTDNALYRLGSDMVVRMPRIHWSTAQVDKEHKWLPFLAPHLPLAIPQPLARGEPAEGYPWRWAVHGWLPGENATIDRLADVQEAARDVARFVIALQRVDPSGAPVPDPAVLGRGAPLATRDARTRQAIASLDGMFDVAAVTAAWDAALAAPVWQGPLVWIHGDIHSGNLLAREGKLAGVIDFGTLGIGDPACDLMVAWNLFTAGARAEFRGAVGVDDATWMRGRGWALSVALIALPYYRSSNPVLAGIARHVIAEVLAEGEGG
jgi:aminoglycoside phosphotransferase (APT) family kinase protein